MSNNGIALKGPAMRSAVGATGTPTTTRASSISTTTGPTTRTTTSASADPRNTRPGAGNAGEGHTLGRAIPGATTAPNTWQQAQPRTVAGPAGAATEHGELPHCDCLNECGDDPALSKGRAQPCQHRLIRLAKKAIENNDITLIEQHINTLMQSGDDESIALAGSIQRILDIRQRWNP